MSKITLTLTVNPSPALVALLMAYQQKWEPRKSLTYLAEECIMTGLTARDRSKQYSEETQNARRFQDILKEHPEYITDVTKMQELARKFGIGSSKGGKTLGQTARALIAEAEADAKAAEETLQAAEQSA